MCTLGSPGGGRYSPDFAIEVAINKRWLHPPLERQVHMMCAEGPQASPYREQIRAERAGMRSAFVGPPAFVS